MNDLVVVAPKARQDLIDIWSYSASRWGIERADVYVRAVWHAVDSLAAQPSLGRDCRLILYRRCLLTPTGTSRT